MSTGVADHQKIDGKPAVVVTPDWLDKIRGLFAKLRFEMIVIVNMSVSEYID